MKPINTESTPKSTQPTLGTCLKRAAHLRCPECGQSPMFRPALKTRTLYDWFTPLDGCPHCGYAYEREPGYFLLATWGSQYFVIAGLGLIVGLTLENLGFSLTTVLCFTCIPQLVLGFLFARHAKAFYLAIDHFIDPHLKHAPDKQEH